MERWQQIETLFQDALQRDPASRDAWLREACRGDSDLRREVASLLANHQEGADFEPWAAAAAAQLIDQPASLKAGQRLGPYEILALIGRGGMGEVYKARDTRLKRDVAIKVCAAQFSERFEREARVIASLNHPNICQLYDVGPNFLVMELVEGENLSGPLPVETALNYARQIAEALEAAHEKGIVHRDLKPGNVKITLAGAVKVLDFGLAKAAEEPTVGVDPATAPTLTMSPTRAGMILGTAPYMAPEQARGVVVDKRADIWAFGCVLYEMLSGKQTFQGETTTDILAAVLKEEPDWSRIPARAQPLLRRCLVKDRKQRLRDIGDAMVIIENTPETRPASSRLVWALAAAVFGVAFAAVSLVHFRETPPAERVLRYTIVAPENTTNLQGFAISPDGHLIAIAAEVSGKRQLWLRALEALEAQPIPGTEDASYPFWSPDSRYIAFFAQGKLKKIAARGGLAQSLCDAPNGLGSWNRDNVILFSRNAQLAARIPIQRVSSAGGVPTDVIGTEGHNSRPMFLPDGRHFLYLAAALSERQTGVYLSSLDGKENRRVLSGVSFRSPVALAAGRLLFIRENTLMAQPFEATSGQTVGEAVPVADGVSGPVSLSETGVLLYQRGVAASRNVQMAWYDRSGKLLGAVGAPGLVCCPAISPDEKSVVFGRSTPSGMDLWLRDFARGAEQRFTTDPSFNRMPFWSPKGDLIVFTSSRGGALGDLYQKAASGTGQEELLIERGNNIKLANQWSKDGRFIVYMSEYDPKTGRDIWALPIDRGAERKSVPFLHSEFDELLGQLSPDSHWMAYTSDESGQHEVYVVAFPTGGGETRISIAGGEQARWRGDGKELFFVGGDGKMMAVAVKAGAPSRSGIKPSFEPGAPQPLFEAHLRRAEALFQYDVTADGKRFLLATIAGGGPASVPVLTVEVNWDARLKR